MGIAVESSNPEVVITNAVSLNTGDAAILEGTIAACRRAFPTVRSVQVLDSNASVAASRYPTIAFQQIDLIVPAASIYDRLLKRMAPFAAHQPQFVRLIAAAMSRPETVARSRLARTNLAAYRAARVIVSTGGTYLVEHYDIRGRLMQLALAISTGAPVVLYTQSLGPFRNRENINALRMLLPRLSLILLRDMRSLEHLRELEVQTPPTYIVADAAFGLADTALLERRLTVAPERKLANVAISVRHWTDFPDGQYGMDRYIASIRALATWLAARGVNVVFLSTCQGVPEYWADDSRLAAEIVSGLDENAAAKVSIDRNFHSPRELMRQLCRYDAVVATRMHMAILALCVGVPVLPIAYEFKTAELFSQIGCGDLVQDLREVSPQQIVGAIMKLSSSLPERRVQMARATLRAVDSARSVPDLLRRALPHDL